MYEQLSQGQGTAVPQANNAFLVNFQSKKHVEEVDERKRNPVEQEQLDDNDYSDVEDQFGRTRRMHRKSSEYLSVVLARDSKRRRLAGKRYNDGYDEDNASGSGSR